MTFSFWVQFRNDDRRGGAASEAQPELAIADADVPATTRMIARPCHARDRDEPR
jgi:hypothetical protein